MWYTLEKPLTHPVANPSAGSTHLAAMRHHNPQKINRIPRKIEDKTRTHQNVGMYQRSVPTLTSLRRHKETYSFRTIMSLHSITWDKTEMIRTSMPRSPRGRMQSKPQEALRSPTLHLIQGISLFQWCQQSTSSRSSTISRIPSCRRNSRQSCTWGRYVRESFLAERPVTYICT